MRPLSVFLGVLLAFVWADVSYAASANPATGRDYQGDPNLPIIKALLDSPEGQVDFARVKVTFDRMVDPKADVQSTLREIDGWAAKVKSRFPPKATNRMKLDILLSTLYQPGPWNQYRPFSYDLASDPFGEKLSNKLIANYLSRRKGQCVSMPIFLAILGQKLGLPVTLTTAPNHLIVKYGDEESGQWINVEATTGQIAPDSFYEESLRIPPLAIKNEIYLRPLSQREAAALMATIVLSGNDEKRTPMPNFKIADAILEVDPKNVIAMVMKANAYYTLIDLRYGNHYKREIDIPTEIRKDYLFLSQQNQWWGQQAEALGWKGRTEEDRKNYLKVISREKIKRGITK